MNINLFLVVSLTIFIPLCWASQEIFSNSLSPSVSRPRPLSIKNPPIPFYRYFDKSLGDHFYTTDVRHVQREKPSYTFQKVLGKVWKDPKSGTVPLFQFYNRETLHHFYTTNLTDIGTVGAIFKGICAFVYEKPEEDTLALYRYYNEGTGDYFLTINSNDLDIPGYSLQSLLAYIYPENYVEVSADLDRVIIEEIIETQRKFSHENLMTEINQKMATNFELLDSNFNALEKSVKALERHPVPVGFIYLQLPNQPEPRVIWPTVRWTEVSSEYAGLFFRVVGGASAEFGTVQHDNAPRITQAETQNSYNAFPGKIDLPVGGTSAFLYSSQFGTVNKFEGTRYTTSGGEVRPENQAIKIWKRSG